MGKFLRVVKVTLVGGIFFLAPIILLIVILEKAFSFIGKIIDPVMADLPGTYIHREGVKEIVAVIIIIAICFLIGLFARTNIAQKIIRKIESSILDQVPGYAFIKKISESIVGLESQDDLPVLLVRVDSGWTLAFQIEKISEDLYTVFIPDAPSPWSGSVVFMKKEEITVLNIKQKQALDIVKKLGQGAGEALKNVVLPQ